MYQDNRHVNYQIAHQQPVMYAGVSTTHQPQQQPQQPHTKIVFVGNLSYFCEDHHLHELFSEYGQVENARVMRSDDNTRSLMFGFVTMHNANQAKEMERIFNGHMFMGRKLR
jgi:RNA recognition motif-containing protein